MVLPFVLLKYNRRGEEAVESSPSVMLIATPSLSTNIIVCVQLLRGRRMPPL